MQEFYKEVSYHGKVQCLWKRRCFRSERFSLSSQNQQNLEAQHPQGKVGRQQSNQCLFSLPAHDEKGIRKISLLFLLFLLFMLNVVFF